jgi:hypothetical protein
MTHPEETSPRPEEQLESIRSMLSAGHHSITLELHSFALWGLGSAFALQVWPRVFTEARFPNPLWLAIWKTLAAAVLVVTTALLDYRLSVRAKRRRDETYSWVQRQMGKLTLLFAALALVLAFGSHFNQWRGVIHVFFVALMGIALTSHGFFSEPFLIWTGIATICLALAEVVLRVPLDATHWISTSAYAVGVTSLGPLQRWVKTRSVATRVACLIAWIGVVAAVGVVCYELTKAPGDPALLGLS